MGRGVGVAVKVGVGIGVGVLVGVGVGTGEINMTPLQPERASPINMNSCKHAEKRTLCRFLSDMISPNQEPGESFREPFASLCLHSHTINPIMRAAPPKEANPAHRNM